MTQRKGIRSANFPAAMYLTEVNTQVRLIDFSFVRIEQWSAAWPQGPTPPREALGYVTLLLSASAMISKLLFLASPGTTVVAKRANQRRARLRELLSIGADAYPVLNSRAVRNQIEHLDESLDEYFGEFKGFGSMSMTVHIGPKPTKLNHFSGRWLDPKTLTLGSHKDSVDLHQCTAEASDLDARISKGFERLNSETYLLW